MNIPSGASEIRRWLWSQDLAGASCRTGIDRSLLYKIREGWVEPDTYTANIIDAARRPRTAAAGRRQVQRLVEAAECEQCGSRERLHRHHIDGDATNNQPTNLRVLCVQCHGLAHRCSRKLDAAEAEAP